MTASVPVLVAGIGARTVVGMTAPASAAAVRAGIARFGEHPYVFDREGNPLQVAQASYLDIDLLGGARLAAMAGPAAAEALRAVTGRAPASSAMPLFVGLPSRRPGLATDANDLVEERLRAEVVRARLKTGQIAWFETGHSAGMMALQAAWQTIRSGTADFALCGGVDSYLEPETLAWLESCDQVHGANDNSWGFIPGEAAGFVLLASPSGADRLEARIAAEVVTVATTRETKLIKTEAVCIGEGLTALFRALGSGFTPGTRVDHLICDMNGEPYRADEFGFAVVRAGELFRDPSGFATPAVCWGDVGAATGPLFVTLCEAEFRRQYSHGPTTAAFTSAESGERCGFVVRARGT